MKSMMLLFGAMGATFAEDRVWCVAPPLRAQTAPGAGRELRGKMRDLSLFVRAASDTAFMGGACPAFMKHTAGNDGLWMLEFDYADHVTKAKKEAIEAGLDVVAVRNQTIIVTGGELVPDALGFDACGSEVNKRVISVAPAAMIASDDYTPAELATHRQYLEKANANVKEALDTVSIDFIESMIEHLQSYNSRNSKIGSNIEEATKWLAEQYTKYGLTVERHHFRDDMGDQVIATFPGSGPEPHIVVVGAHSDSRSTLVNSATQRAPGADDNGSGTTALLCLAQALQKTNIKLRHTLVLMSFTGEEQGLIGSRAIAKEYKEQGVKVDHMLNADMLGYKLPNEQRTLAFMDRYSSPAATAYAAEIVRTYVPGLPTGVTTGCCSDQQAFQEQGFRSVGMFEHPGSSVLYPQYHRSTDLLEYLDSAQLLLETQALIAAALVMAEPLE